jgi:16S rRNA (cytosine967-C5)-methyltransferase
LATTGVDDARRLAWETLVAVEAGAFADAELGRRLAAARLQARDRSLATLLVYGTLSWQGLLDHIIAACGRPAELLDVPVRTVLRLALFQLVKLSRVPDFAVVDTAVELSKTFRGGAATGMVNAVLRRFLRQGKEVPMPAREDDLSAHLAATLSHPRWLVDLWLGELGQAETESLLCADNAPSATVLRANRTRRTRAQLIEDLRACGVSARETRFAPQGVVLEEGVDPTALPGYGGGWFSLQGEASQLVALLVDARPGQRILDACAAPGGKATGLAEQMADRGAVIAADRRAARSVRRTCQRLGLSCVKVLRADVLQPCFRSDVSFDAVLLDAPCSGLGTLRQHPEIRWRRSLESVDAVAALQRRLLEVLAPRVRPGAVLLYATCTISARENERLVESFLSAHGEFVLDDPRPSLPAAARELIDAKGFFRSFPHRHGLDGFFAARLKRRATGRKVLVRP